MFRRVIACCGLVACGSVDEADEQIGTDSEQIIGNQRSAKAYAEAVLVSVHNEQADFCSGVLVSPHVVLTSAHCIVFNRNGTWTITVPFATTGRQVIRASHAEPMNRKFYTFNYCCYDSEDVGVEDIGAIYLDKAVTGVKFPRIAKTEYYSSTSTHPVWVSAVGRRGVAEWAGLVLSDRTKLYRTVPADGYTTDYRTLRLTDGGDSGGPLFIDGTHNLVGLETRFDTSAAPERDYWARLDGAVYTWIQTIIATHGGPGPTW